MSQNNEFKSLAFDMPKNKSNVIKVVGVGGGGSNAINYMFQQGIEGVDFVICNTDAQALQNSGVPNKIQLGVSLTEGLGAGANPEVGEQAAVESLDDIKKMLETNTKMVFITAGMGGGTGTGAAPVIAKLSKELGILTVGIVTMPFQFEGRVRNKQAQSGIEKLREHVDSLVVINNNKLRDVYGNLGFKSGFSKADEVLASASRGIAEVITKHYTQNIDLHDAKTVLRNSGTAIMGSAKAAGDNRAQDAIMAALDSPLLNDNKITGAKNVLLLIVSGTKEITLDEIGEINDHIQAEAGHSADIIMGVGDDDDLEDAISVTIIATGFNIDQQDEITNTEVKKVVHHLSDEPTVEPSASSPSLTTTPKPSEPIIKHTLTFDDDLETTSKDEKPKINVTDAQPQSVNPVDIVFEKVEDGTNNKLNDDDFVINDVTASETDLQNNDTTTSAADEQITLTFDLPISTAQHDDNPADVPSTPEPIVFHLEDDVAVKETNVTSATSEENENTDTDTNSTDDQIKRYVLETVDTDEEGIEFSKPKPEPTDPLEDMVLKTSEHTTDITPSNTENVEQLDVDPLHSSISELMKLRANERRRTLKAFNHKFNTAKIDEIENEPAYKRQGVSLDDTQHSTDNNASRFSVSTDDNDDVTLRSDNSFLHDNVD